MEQYAGIFLFQDPYYEEDLAALDGSDGLPSSLMGFGFKMSKLLIFVSLHLPSLFLLFLLHLF